MSLMGVEKKDCTNVFGILDRDGSGDVDYDEFVEEMYRMKNDDVHTMVMFTKHHVQEIKRLLMHKTRPNTRPNTPTAIWSSTEPADQCPGLGHWEPSVVEEKWASAKESVPGGDFRESVGEMKRVINEELLGGMHELMRKLDMQTMLIKRWTQGPGFHDERHGRNEDVHAVPASEPKFGNWSKAPSPTASPTPHQPAQEVPFSCCGAPKREQNNVGSSTRQAIPQQALLPNPAQSMSRA
eukprot:CAMPEP_0177373138 /NCGR_PEP_ID=MMETSP0368-20130122/43433_1 /TAXON_ID=447022 ORGANISM="Scrippsiella hangoei-like, Strain SHHI-4" /NCGR_SAMPLE_ID=MMETSP0368 /ASSEMBLY_ACC=CAM_ASM_000363 /LENGTH=238 /DNA_ID=CAMNT_0018836585 /DNA_START=1 /DNA_END=717 /DNA_ORIENTATION=-